MFGHKAKSTDQLLQEHAREFMVTQIMHLAKENPELQEDLFEMAIENPNLRAAMIKRVHYEFVVASLAR